MTRYAMRCERYISFNDRLGRGPNHRLFFALRDCASDLREIHSRLSSLDETIGELDGGTSSEAIVKDAQTCRASLGRLSDGELEKVLGPNVLGAFAIDGAPFCSVGDDVITCIYQGRF